MNVICDQCGEEFDPVESDAVDNTRFCTPECEGDANEEEEWDDWYYDEYEEED